MIALPQPPQDDENSANSFYRLKKLVLKESLIQVERRDGFAIVMLNRPERMNALVPELLAEFDAAMHELDADPGIFAVVLTGKGKAFCAGLDVAVLQEAGPEPFLPFNPARTISQWKGPVIAAVNGLAVTGGFEITVACDIVLACPDAAFVDTHSRVGLLPGWGLSVRLHRAIGIYRAKELELTGRRLPAAEAADWGLVNRVVPADELLDAACAMARTIADGAPGLPAETKALIDNVSLVPMAEGLVLEQQIGFERQARSGRSLSFAHVGQSK
ncbi:MAG: enoyl-CoA hydratase-related protein [Sphingobium sp.]